VDKPQAHPPGAGTVPSFRVPPFPKDSVKIRRDKTHFLAFCARSVLVCANNRAINKNLFKIRIFG
jgi:hypothetical protein